MAHHSASFSLTLRVHLDDHVGSFANLARAIADAGGLLGAIDLVRVGAGYKTRDVSVLATDDEHARAIVAACENVAGVVVEHVSDRTFLLHLGGKIEMESKVPVKTRDDLSMAYTPGVARVCRAIAADPDSVWELTIKRNTVAVVTDGSAVLGLGDIGPAAAMPVMEGKALLFKEFGGVDAWPICLDTKDPDRIVETVQAIAPGFGGINLEDISAPRCFEIEERLRGLLDIPVFHDDQHGTAVVVLAAFLNALRVVGKRDRGRARSCVTGVGAAGVAVTKTLQAAGVRNVIGADSQGAIHLGREGLTAVKQRYAESTNPEGIAGSADDALAGADVFIGLSQPGAVSVERRALDGGRRDRVRDGEPDAGGRARGDRGARRGDRHGPLGLPQPDQQRARLPGHLPRRARRARARDHRADGGRGGPRDRRDRRRRRARRRLHRAERVQPRRRRERRGRGRRRRGRGRRLAAHPRGRRRAARVVAPARGEIPHRSQRDADDARWARCGCGMACLQMILGARGDGRAGARGARARGAGLRRVAAEPQRVGYGPLIYAGFVEFVAAEHGLAARVAAPLAIDELIAAVSGDEVVLASVSAEIRELPLVPARRGGHLVLVFDASADGARVLLPRSRRRAGRPCGWSARSSSATSRGGGSRSRWRAADGRLRARRGGARGSRARRRSR